ncbi:hypothetical protein B0H66DRAFT_396797 [Apodospora peruviana]|uniref:Zn(2)-C6 fungal-type domain-containing protein n=1 Tax=Apodospora peruviana TaxID=516989 RepID=A0AAE0HUP9_9PEZI|nr:hypothetical protein B0H66DRAFT_396797 [Apodospora peruviana]
MTKPLRLATQPIKITCQTCHSAKIRCEKTQDSASCDRCLRLDKECVFPPARRRVKHRIDPLQARLNQLASGGNISDAKITNQGYGATYKPDDNTMLLTQLAVSSDLINPLGHGWLDAKRAEDLFNVFRTQLAPRFPFVVVSETLDLDDMRRNRPCTHLVILAVACSEDFVLQRKLSRLFNQVVTARLAAGKFVSFDMLQALLLHLAWAHFSPRPRSYTQQLHLAISIVSDLRLYRPRTNDSWNLDKAGNEGQHVEWSHDELRALIGTYYLDSSTAIVLQKMRTMSATGFMAASYHMLEAQAEYPSDKYLRHIVHLQQILEEVDGINESHMQMNQTGAMIGAIRDKIDSFKLGLPFAISDCPVLQLQLNSLEVLISQKALPGFPGRVQQRLYDSPQLVIDAISECISATKSVADSFLVLPLGYEHRLSNIEWIVLSWSISFSARLHVMAGHPATLRLQRRLDFRHTLRQVTLRLQSLASPLEDSTGDRDVFYHFLRRGRIIESWYLRQTDLDSLSTPYNSIGISPDQINIDANNTAELNQTRALNVSSGLDPGFGLNPGFENVSFADFFAEEMRDPAFAMFLGDSL